jgi:hypothetical protein
LKKRFVNGLTRILTNAEQQQEITGAEKKKHKAARKQQKKFQLCKTALLKYVFPDSL